MDSSLIRVRPIRAMPKPFLLKDHLLDDMSSCSSNGFKSFPRRSQCCTTVRFLHDLDRRNKKPRQKKKYSNYSKITALSAIQGFVAAVKRLPFAAAKSREKKKLGSSFFHRSFSKKLLEKSSFWKRSKADRKEIGRWKLYDNELVKEEEIEPSAGSDDSSRDSSKSDSWSGSDFTVSEDFSSGKYSTSEVNLNLPEVENDVRKVPVKVGSDSGVGVAQNGDVSNDSISSSDGGSRANTNSPTKDAKQKQWSSEEKEQFSPVSVLDCPFDDDDEVSSLFKHRLARMEGTKTKLMKKIQRFECLAKLEPVKLATHFALQSDNSDNESLIGSPLPHSSSSIDDKSIHDVEEEKDEDDENEAEHKALELLHQLKATLPSYDLKLKSDDLLLDFFREKITDKRSNSDKLPGACVSTFEKGLLEEAEDWINGGKTRELFLEWEVQKNRQAYVKDMEKGGEWKTCFDQERQQVALDLENVVFDEILNEVLLEISILGNKFFK